MLRIAALVCALVLMSSVASAQLYVEGRIGVSFMPDSEATFVRLSPPPRQAFEAGLSWGNGATGGAAIGYAFDFGLRTEINVNGQGNLVENLKLIGYLQPPPALSPSTDCPTPTNTGGVALPPSTVCFSEPASASTVTTMFEVLYDIKIPNSPLVPYLGVGVGVQHTSLSQGTYEAIYPFSGSFTAFAWEVAGGVSYPIRKKVDLTLNYRYVKAQGTHAFAVISPFGVDTNGLTADFASHNVTGGLRYTFDLF